MFSKCDSHADGSYTIPKGSVARWRRQMVTPYSDLPQSEKDSDLIEADKFLALISEFNNSSSKTSPLGKLSSEIWILGAIAHQGKFNENKEDFVEVLTDLCHRILRIETHELRDLLCQRAVARSLLNNAFPDYAQNDPRAKDWIEARDTWLKKNKGEMMESFGQELILDLHDCDPSTYDSREKLEKFFVGLCDLIDMEREDLHFWDYEGHKEEYDAAPAHLKGISAVQFIKTSNITIHTLDELKKVYLNVFSCKAYLPFDAIAYCEKFFGGNVRTFQFIERR